MYLDLFRLQGKTAIVTGGGKRVGATIVRALLDDGWRVVAHVHHPDDPVPDGAIGMIEVRGPNVFQGYRRMPEKTAAELRPNGFFITGDLGRFDERGYLQIVGRGKDLIITGGFNVYPKEVESEIDALPGVTESAVIGLPHPDFGEGVTAVVVPSGTPSLTEAAVLAPLESRLAKFKLPKRVVFLDELPRNTMGKVQKNLLRDRFADRCSDRRDQLEAALSGGDRAAVIRIAHDLAGTAGIFGYPGLSHSAQALEEAARGAAVSFDELRFQTHAVIAKLPRPGTTDPE